MSTIAIEAPTPEQLERMLDGLVQGATNVELVAAKYAGELARWDRETAAAIAKEGEPLPELVAPIQAAEAWHLHVFARDAEEAARNVIGWSKAIDLAAHHLYQLVQEERAGIEAEKGDDDDC